MLHDLRLRIVVATALATMACGLSACTSPREYFRNGFKVGPSYGPPAAPLPKHWIDHNDENLKQQACANLSCWWAVFDDPKLNQLVVYAYRQNLTLRQAGYRVLQTRAMRSIAVGSIFPQQQAMTGSYQRIATVDGGLGGDRFFDAWNTDFSLSWELDFWGRYRRAVAAANDNLDASVANYDQVIVTLLADVAQNYVIVRTDQQRIKYLVKNVKLQTEVFDYIGKQREAGFRVSDLEYNQAKSNLYQTKAAIPQLMIDMRQAENRLCFLLGMPVVDLDKFLGINLVDKSDEELLKMTSEELEAYLNQMLGKDPIPRVPADIVVNLPADLLRQRPDVRAAERLAASQGEQIGIAQADLYPSFFLNGSLGYSARDFRNLFKYDSFNGNWGPSFQWNLLNYGRIVNNVRLQDAMFRELVLAYQQTVLNANLEVENGIVTFLRSQDRAFNLGESVNAARVAVDKAKIQYEKGAGANKDLTTYAVIQQNLVTQEDTYAQSVGQIAQGLIQVYRALGGGWEIRFNEQMAPAPGPTPLPPVEPLDSPQPQPQAAPVDIPKPSDQP
jgi:outer membrane protein TolC